MQTKPEVLAVVLARGASKTIPRKNVKPFGGAPLIAWSFAAALQSACVTRAIITTDDEEIAGLARDWGIEVPFMRPDDLAQDHTPDLPVFQHVVQWFKENENYRPDIVIQLRPTSPFRPPGCIDDAVDVLLNNPNADSVRAVVPSDQNPYKMWRQREDGSLDPLLKGEFDEPYNMPRQLLPPTYWQIGLIDAIRTEVIENNSMSGKNIYPLHVDHDYAVDIDTPLNWSMAEWLIENHPVNLVRPIRQK